MANIEELKQEELNQLTEDKPVASLEELITNGANLKVPITFDFPTQDGVKQVNAVIRPLTSSEWEEATNYAMKHKKNFALKILEKGLLNIDETPLTMELLELMPVGVVTAIYRRIADISGVKQDKKEQFQFTKELLGF